MILGVSGCFSVIQGDPGCSRVILGARVFHVFQGDPGCQGVSCVSG